MKKQRLIDIRTAKKITQQEMADKLCLHNSSYCKYENGQTKINSQMWEKIAKILGVSWVDIFEEEQMQVLINKDNATGTNWGINNYYNDTNSVIIRMEKFIQKLEEEIQIKDVKISILEKENYDLKISKSL